MPDALPVAGGPCWFTHVEQLSRSQEPSILPASEIPEDVRQRLTASRAPIAGLSTDRPRIMGILNVTPDSFSDGGQHDAPAQAVRVAGEMIADGADMIDIGGESTRPGAIKVPVEEETRRTAPVIAALRSSSNVPISIDTRKAAVAEKALDAGASLVNDVSGFTYDGDLAPLCAEKDVPVCVMHAQGEPDTMQIDPQYDNVLLDVYDALAQQVNGLTEAGIPLSRIIVDPGIGFGKTLAHNLTLLRNISLFHGLGCVILLGASRKRFIGTVGQAPDAASRAPGSIAVGLAGLAQGVQILRVHDVAETKQAIRLWTEVRRG